MAEAVDSGQPDTVGSGPPDTVAPGERAWPTRHGGGYPPGWLVRYRCRTHRGTRSYRGSYGGSYGYSNRDARGGREAANVPAPDWQERGGTVAGRSLRDEHTGTTWVPIRPYEAAQDSPADLVRATDILDARPPGAPRSER
jgi:hypothetical protein